MELTQLHALNFTNALSESKKIILSRFNHFITLSILFFPLSFSLITNSTFRLRIPDEPYTVYTEEADPSNHHKHVIYYLIYTLLVHILTICAIGTITYSTHHAFLGKPTKILYALKSLIFSFFPLASTMIAAYTIVVLMSLSFLMFVATIVMLAHNLGFDIDYNSVYFNAIMGAILLAGMICFPVNWSLAFAVVVVESKWGFAALMRSSYLAKGIRSVSWLVRLYFVVFGGFVVVICSANVMALTTLGLIFVTMVLLRITAANTVMYNYYKALHGELAIEGFHHDNYMSLPSYDEKVPQVVTIVAA